MHGSVSFFVYRYVKLRNKNNLKVSYFATPGLNFLPFCFREGAIVVTCFFVDLFSA